MIPIKDTIPRRTYPFATVAIIFINSAIFLFETTLPESQLQNLIELFGLVPARYSHPALAESLGAPIAAYLPFLTNMFLHGGWLHIVVNMWSLYIFGDNVEDLLGPLRFILFYLLAGIAANLVHFLANQQSTLPVIGASGAVAGIMAGYLRLFPRARIIVLFPVLFLPFFFEVPALLFMGFWFITQLFSGAATLLMAHEGGGIAWWAHIGGFVIGLILIRPMCSKHLGGCHADEVNHYVYR